MAGNPSNLVRNRPPPGTINARQQAFITEYLRDFNATRAAIASGYSARNAASLGSRLIHQPNIAAEIKRRGDADADALGITRAYVLTNTRKVFEKAMVGAPRTAGQQGLVVKDDDGNIIYEWSPAGAIRALELLAKLRGDLIERQEIKTLGIQIVLNDVNVEDLT